jgi:prolyl 4-hydroxylase
MHGPSARAIARAWHVAGNGRLRWRDGFLRPSSCQRVLEQLRAALWQRSRVRRRVDHQSASSRRRQSSTANETSFSPDLLRTIRGLDRRLERLIPRFTRRRERWQATRYGVAQRYDDHCDAGAFAHQPQGERAYTVMIYLQSPRAGGSTRFRRLGLEVAPVAGRLVIWSNLTPASEVDGEMLHASLPVLAGCKTVLVTHVRQRQTARPRIRRGPLSAR